MEEQKAALELIDGRLVARHGNSTLEQHARRLSKVSDGLVAVMPDIIRQRNINTHSISSTTCEMIFDSELESESEML